MARKSPAPPAGQPLEGSVRIVGVRPKISLAERDVAVADVAITLTGGSDVARTPATFSIGLNAPLAARGRAQLIDEATQSRIAVATRSGGAYVFKNVPVNPSGKGRSRTYRITNVRANASGLGSGGLGTPGQIMAFVAASAPFRIPLSGAQQNVAVVRRS